MIDVRPDPQHPDGGYALFTAQAGQLPDGTVEIEVLDKYRGHYLAASGFQPHRHGFGPYQVERQGDLDVVRVGPEIVNQIEEFASLQIAMGGLTADVSWPDEVFPLPGAPAIGGIRAVDAEEPGSGLSGPVPVPPAPEPAPPPPAPPVPEPEPGPEVPEEEESADEDGEEDPRGGRGLWIAALLIVLAIGAGAGWWLWQESRPDEPPVRSDTSPVPPPEADACAPAGLLALGESDSTAMLAQLLDCGDAVTADDALGAVEAAQRAGDAEAMRLMGQFYDGETADGIETATGLSFGDDPARAAEYYRRAKDAGSDAAADLLAQSCERLAGMSDTLARNAAEEYCE
ncbi:sel1 repeat family protein [Mangrovicoccus sp. HB161399]|uniref:sel1 repeat family protein n=1 Tax=Mangrovicoccus sp. HB161399 TaxID=2720392 RepID=UPI001556F4D4|nr:sel1 repeat family protein [Mangrovicoccus sp. HB161399]